MQRCSWLFRIKSVVFLGMIAVSGTLAQDLKDMHPSFDRVDLLPAGFEEGIGGMDFLPDGKLAVCTWGGKAKNNGKVFLFSGLTGAARASEVSFQEIASKLNEPLGLKVVGRDIYFMQKHEMSKLTLGTNGSFSLSTAYTGFVYDAAQYHQFSTGLIFKDSAFYFMATSSHAPRIESANRGALIRIDLATKQDEMIANGMREPNSLFLGPDNELFTTDNQGEWMPANKLIHLKKGRTFGMHGPDAPIAVGKTISPPAIWIPYGDASRSVTAPILLKSGMFKGQILAGDVAYGGLIRMMLEKVKGEYQGAVFRFAAPSSLTCGINRIVYGPDQNLYLGGIGGGGTLGGAGNWAWNFHYTGFEKLKPNTKVAFEMLAIHSNQTGFDIELTKPLAVGGIDPTNFSITKWWYMPEAAYGKGKQPSVAVTLNAVSISPDRRKIKLELSGFEPLKVYHIKTLDLKAEGDESMRSSEAWYTVLNLGSPDPVTQLASSTPKPEKQARFWISNQNFNINLPSSDLEKRWRLIGSNGAILASGKINSQGTLVFPKKFPPQISHLMVQHSPGVWSMRARLQP